MKTLFPGYFTPTEAEFRALWDESIFAFDANVLLGLYRSSSETRQIFFDVIEKIRDRIFLPNQAAREYLENRLGVISLRLDTYGKIKNESEKLAKYLESITQEHAIPNGKEIVALSKDAAKAIAELVTAAEANEPDLLSADDLMERIAELFSAKTGQPFDQSRLREIYSDAAQRYKTGIPQATRMTRKVNQISTATF